MRCLLLSERVRFNGLAAAFLLICLICNPAGLGLILALQAAPLPDWLASIVYYLYGLSIFLGLIWGGLGIIVPIIAVWSVLHLKYRPFNRLFPVCLLGWIILWGGTFPENVTRKLIREPGLLRITQQSQPLINAIEANHAENGQYPEKLEALVPEFISAIPSTGAAGFRNFAYYSQRVDGLFTTYELSVHTPGGLLNGDSLVYWPGQNYEADLKGQYYRLIGDWIYLQD